MSKGREIVKILIFCSGFDDERRQVPDIAEVQGLRQDEGD